MWQQKMWPNSKTDNLIEPKNWICEKTENVTTKNSKCNRTQITKMWQNSKTQNSTKLKNSRSK